MSSFSATAAFLLIISITTVVKAQPSTATCAQKLVPCGPYLNSINTPPANCCNPIKEAVANDRVCLCNLYNDPSFLPSIGINVTKALNLTQKCGVNPDTSNCSNVSALSPESPASVPPPPPESDACRIMWIGLPSFVVLWASSFFY